MGPLMNEIDINEYDYPLPEGRIAQHPLPERDRSKLLVYRSGTVSEDIFGRIAEHLLEKSHLVFNNTRVVRARLLFKKKSGSAIEVFCLEPLSPAGYEESFGSRVPVEWKCLAGNLKKWKHEVLSSSCVINGSEYHITAEDLGESGEARRVRFSWENPGVCFADVLEAAGHMPLPPYIAREDSVEDSFRYQTVYSRIRGSVAAPTAGLHFTESLLESLRKKGIGHTDLTLHVGAGTFQPVRSRYISGHEMHTEHFVVTVEAISAIIKNEGKIIAVGTTSCRTLESLYWLGCKVAARGFMSNAPLLVDQWEPYGSDPGLPARDSLEILLGHLKRSGKQAISASTRLIIMPGYKFHVTDGLITNFHQPKSTLLLLVSAWTGDDWKKIYAYALANDFRFLSYGDSSLLLR
jgi:S-adenosylmethionine:tRNA ribosyltransferase-isomerase